MKLSKQDVDMFKALSKSGLGKELVSYLSRLEDFICDSRSWGKDDTKESAKKAAESVKMYIRQKISTTGKEVTPDDYS